MGVSHTPREGLVMKFTFLQKEEAFFTQAFKSDDINSLKKYNYHCILQFYTDKIENKLKYKMGRQTAFAPKMYCAGPITMTVGWINKNMKIIPEEMADLLGVLYDTTHGVASAIILPTVIWNTTPM